MAVVTLNGIDIHHEVYGDVGDPWVLNIGGSGGDLRHTFPDRSPLNKHFRVVHYDQRGLGQTTAPATDYTMADYADDAAALIAEVAGSPCHVVGTSFGGMVALNLAVRHPHLVDKLVLLCTSPGGDHPSYPLHELAEMDVDQSFPIRMRNMDTRWDPDADEPIPGLGVVYDIVAEQARNPATGAEADGARRQLEARSHHDVVDQLGTIGHDTLICAGRFDGTAPLANAEFMAERMPSARLEVFDGGHLLMFQDRRAFPTVIDFLQGSPTT